MTQYYKIANLTVAMDSFGRTVEQAEPYLCAPAEPDITIQSDWRALQVRQPHLSDEDSEYLTSGGSFYRQLLNFDGMMLHSSAVVRDGKAYLFTAACGTGKSTHTKLWLKNFPDAFILNDDKPALRLEDGKFYAYGTPWNGKEHFGTTGRTEVTALCFVDRGEENSIKEISTTEAVTRIFSQIMLHDSTDVATCGHNSCLRLKDGRDVVIYHGNISGKKESICIEEISYPPVPHRPPAYFEI